MSSRLICRGRAYPTPNLLRASPFGRATPTLNSFYTAQNKSCSSQLRFFSHTLRAMTASKIDGTAIAKSIRERIAGEIQQAQQSNPRYRPSLTIVQGMH